jgi:hypothetical protein
LYLFLDQNVYNFNTKDWEKNGKELLSFTASKFPGKLDIIKDALSFDWCLSSYVTNYPSFIFDEANIRLKKEVLNGKFIIKGNMIKIQEEKIDLSVVKRALYFSAKTDYFREKYLYGKKQAIFIPQDKDKKKILYL